MSESFCGADTRKNVGKFDCDEARKFPNKLIIGSKAFVLADAVDNDTFFAALTAATQLDNGSNSKLWPIHTLLDPQDQTAANTEGAVGEGVPQVLVEGKPKFQYSVEIGNDLFKRLRKFNKKKVKIFTYDDAGNLWGAKDADGNFVGCEAVIFVSGNRQQTASAPVSAQITISYTSAVNYNDDGVYVPVELGEFEPSGLLDGELVEISHSANVYKIGFVVPTARYGKTINLWEKYNAVIVAGLFTAFTGATFATSLAITSVAYDATLKAGTVTLDSTAYTALASGAKIKLLLDPVADLVAAGIEGIEGVPVIITKP